MSTLCKDCGVQGKGVHHCEQYHNQTHSIAEYQHIEKELQAKVEELTGELSIWKRRYNELYEAGIKLTSEYKKRAALKQEGCYEDIDIRL